MGVRAPTCPLRPLHPLTHPLLCFHSKKRPPNIREATLAMAFSRRSLLSLWFNQKFVKVKNQRLRTSWGEGWGRAAGGRQAARWVQSFPIADLFPQCCLVTAAFAKYIATIYKLPSQCNLSSSSSSVSASFDFSLSFSAFGPWQQPLGRAGLFSDVQSESQKGKSLGPRPPAPGEVTGLCFAGSS